MFGQERFHLCRIGFARYRIRSRCEQLVFKGLKCSDRKHREIYHGRAPLLPMRRLEPNPKTADGGSCVRSVRLASRKRKPSDDRDASRLKHRCLRKRNTLTVAEKKTADAYAFCVIATKARMHAAHRFKRVCDSRRSKSMWREPTARV